MLFKFYSTKLDVYGVIKLSMHTPYLRIGTVTFEYTVKRPQQKDPGQKPGTERSTAESRLKQSYWDEPICKANFVTLLE